MKVGEMKKGFKPSAHVFRFERQGKGRLGIVAFDKFPDSVWITP
ncbi:MAG: hypothetical protein QXE61_05040 [Nitrososphaerota archaeon]